MTAEVRERSPVAAVIVVAGGRSTRFGTDKLRHRVDGGTLLERTAAAAAAVAPVVLVTADDVPPGLVAVSESPRWGGPCAAVAAGVDAVAGSGDVLVVPADLADPASALQALAAIEEGVLTDPGGHPQWLLARMPVAGLRERLTGLRSSGSGLAGLPASALFRDLPGRHPVPAAVCADIDTPADLAVASLPSSPRTRHVPGPDPYVAGGLVADVRRGAEEGEGFVHGTV